MILKRFYDEKLAQASFLVGCAGSGEAIVIDPVRDPWLYIRAAEAEGLKITAVTETHIHADYASGSRELARATGATLYLSDEGDENWKYGFADDATLIRDGSSFHVGAIRFDVLATPGHTPEHVSFLVTDEPASSEPWGIFTGDLLFVGDVGRPDLLETAAGMAGTMEAGARDLYRSIQEIKRLPDHVLVWPGHGAGSACGKSLGGVPVSTIGFEKRSNWALRAGSEAAFADEVLAGQPDPPTYFAEMKRINKSGPPILGGLQPLKRLEAGELRKALLEATVLDIRPSLDHAQRHAKGSLHIPLGRFFTGWAGWLLPYGRPLYLVARNEADATEAARDLRLIGLDDVRGWFDADGLSTVDTDVVRQIEPDRVPELALGDEAVVLDVRSKQEYDRGHLPQAVHIPLGHLARDADRLPKDRPIAIHCQSGARSPIGASVLLRVGIHDVRNVIGGFSRMSEDPACESLVCRLEPSSLSEESNDRV